MSFNPNYFFNLIFLEALLELLQKLEQLKMELAKPRQPYYPYVPYQYPKPIYQPQPYFRPQPTIVYRTRTQPITYIKPTITQQKTVYPAKKPYMVFRTPKKTFLGV